MALDWQKHPILLGSQSPRRAQLLKELGLKFRMQPAEIEETYPKNLSGAEIAEYLAHKKAQALQQARQEDEILLCSDTVVWLKGESLEKAGSKAEAKDMLRKLSDQSHAVISGFYLGDGKKDFIGHDQTTVYFKALDEALIDYYIDQFAPFDKAGAYGIQEWIGMVGIEKIEGSYFTVMGLPCHLIAEQLRKW